MHGAASRSSLDSSGKWEVGSGMYKRSSTIVAGSTCGPFAEVVDEWYDWRWLGNGEKRLPRMSRRKWLRTP